MEENKDVRIIVQVGLNKGNQVVVSGQVGNKKLCVALLAHAILIVNGIEKEKSKIITPRGNM